jgi:hypothetical protein
MKLLKSAIALISGLIVGAALSIGTDFILELTGVLPSYADQMAHGLFITSLLVLALFYRCVYTVLGGYLAARLAPDHPMRHAMILGWFGFVVSLIGAYFGRNLGPLWYPISLAILTPACTWLGAKLKK